MFYIISKNDNKGTFTVLDTEDMSTDVVSKDDALKFFKTTGIEYRVMLNSTMVSCKDYCVLYISTENCIKGVLLKCGRYTKAVGFQKECKSVGLEVVDNTIKLVFRMTVFGAELKSTNIYIRDLSLIEEGNWERG